MSSPSPLDVRDQIGRLRVFLRWLIPVAGTFAALELVAWRMFDDGQSLGAGVVIGAYVFLACAALWRLRDGRLTEAAVALSVGTMVMAIVLATLQPVIYPPLIVVALMATGVALSYLEGRALIVTLVASWACAVTIAAVGLLSPSPSPLPTWFVVAFESPGSPPRPAWP